MLIRYQYTNKRKCRHANHFHANHNLKLYLLEGLLMFSYIPDMVADRRGQRFSRFISDLKNSIDNGEGRRLQDV